MNHDELHEAVQRLSTELLKLDAPDPETQAKITALLERLQDPEPLIGVEEQRLDLAELIDDGVTHFEVSHPQLTEFFARVASLLNSIGI